MAGEVVHDHDVAGAQGRHQDVRDIGLEPVAVDRPVENHWRDHAVEAEARHQRRGLAVAMREPHAEPLAPWAAPVAPRHVRGRPAFVDEHEFLGVEIGLRLEPGAALPQDVCAVLLNRMPGLFSRHAVALEKARQRGGRHGDAAPGQTAAQLLEALVALLLERGHDVCMPRLDPPRAHVAALRLRLEAPRRLPLRVPADHRRHRDAKTPRCRPTAHPSVDRSQRPPPQVHR